MHLNKTAVINLCDNQTSLIVVQFEFGWVSIFEGSIDTWQPLSLMFYIFLDVPITVQVRFVLLMFEVFKFSFH